MQVPDGRDFRPWWRTARTSEAVGVDSSVVIEMCRVLGDPVRWSVVTALRGGTRCACELAESSGAAPSLLSHHLGVLRDAGLITAERRGRWIDYTLIAERLDELAEALTDAGPGSVPARSQVA